MHIPSLHSLMQWGIVQVLSKNVLEANDLLKTHQTQLLTSNNKLKVLEDKVNAERDSRNSELSLVTDKLSLAERQLSTRDASMLALKMDAHQTQQVNLPHPPSPPMRTNTHPHTHSRTNTLCTEGHQCQAPGSPHTRRATIPLEHYKSTSTLTLENSTTSHLICRT